MRQEIEKGKKEDKRRKEKVGSRILLHFLSSYTACTVQVHVHRTMWHLLQAAQRVLVEEYKRRKEDAKLQREHDEAVRTRIEAESRRQLVYERVKFQQRVRDKIMNIFLSRVFIGTAIIFVCITGHGRVET